jgi:tRNA threonylcarbamoyl adenosine modification protein YeaZ
LVIDNNLANFTNNLDCLLAIDCSSSSVNLALHVKDKSYTFCALDNASAKLPQVTNNLLQQAKVKTSDISKIVVGLGPGSFTGLRVSLAFIHGLNSVINCEVLGVSSYLALAYSFLVEKDDLTDIFVLGNARSNETFYFHFRVKIVQGKKILETKEHLIISPIKELESRLQPFQGKKHTLLVYNDLPLSLINFETVSSKLYFTKGLVYVANNINTIVKEMESYEAYFSFLEVGSAKALEPFYLKPVLAKTRQERNMEGS